MIYLKDETGIYVNLFLPSEVTWKSPAFSANNEIKIVQETKYPDADTTSLKLTLRGEAKFALRLAVLSFALGLLGLLASELLVRRVRRLLGR